MSRLRRQTQTPEERKLEMQALVIHPHKRNMGANIVGGLGLATTVSTFWGSYLGPSLLWLGVLAVGAILLFTASAMKGDQ